MHSWLIYKLLITNMLHEILAVLLSTGQRRGNLKLRRALPLREGWDTRRQPRVLAR